MAGTGNQPHPGLAAQLHLRFLLNMVGFWTPDARAVGRWFHLLLFPHRLSHALRFFPDWFSPGKLHPFPYVVNTVVEVYLGVSGCPQLWFALPLSGRLGRLLLDGCEWSCARREAFSDFKEVR